MITYKEFAKIIKEKRELAFIAQKDIASKIPISKYSYNRIENGLIEPNFFVLQRICQIFELDFTEICKLKEPNQTHIKCYD